VDIEKASGTEKTKCVCDGNGLQGAVQRIEQIGKGLRADAAQAGFKFAESLLDGRKSGE